MTGGERKTMPDKEKVIKGLELLKDFLGDGLPGKRVVFNSYIGIANDAIILLKEQEAKTGHWIDTTKVIGFPRVQCSVCGSGQGAIWMNHCPNCGAKMEDR